MVLIQPPKHLDGLTHRGASGYGDVLGGHHPACGAIFVAQKADDLSGVFHAHEMQEGLGFLVGKVTNDVSRIIRVHVADELSSGGIIQVIQEFRLHLIHHLGDRL